MKFLILPILAVVAVAGVTAVSHQHQLMRLQWTQFKSAHSKTYAAREELKRFQIFTERLREIEEHNKLYNEGKTSYKMGINKFSDWTKEEFMAYVNKGLNEGESVRKQYPTKLYAAKNVSAAPADFDWRGQQITTPVKDQGQCGSCYAFSATGGLESQLMLTHGQLISLSEQDIVDCSKDFANFGCGGGSLPNCYNYVFNHGISAEADYPYEAVDGTCRRTQSVLSISSYGVVPDDENTLVSAVYEMGPISIGIHVIDSWMSYGGGVYNDQACTPTGRNHAVVIIGYGVENGQDYWLIRNSWGPGWGEAGHIKLARNAGDLCAVATDASWPIVV